MGTLGRMFDRIFFGGGRPDEVSATSATSQPARPSIEDRARYDSGTSIFYH